MTVAARPLERAYTRCRFGQLHYLGGGAEGAEAGPPLVLLHQNPSSCMEYVGFAQEMAKDRRVIAFDTPGYGMSDPPPGPPGLDGYAAAFADGLDALDWSKGRKVDVFGFHTGTYLATELALSRPDLVGRLILAGIPFRPAHERATRLEAARTPLTVTEDGAAVFDYLRHMWDFTVGGRSPATAVERAAEMFVDRLRAMQRSSWPYIGVWSYPAETKLPRLTQPVLVAQPHEMLLEHSRAAAALIPHVTWVELPDLDRDVFEHGVADFARAIRAWTT
jgi:pimeloyl-ACP methyl ester carboxylesterase